MDKKGEKMKRIAINGFSIISYEIEPVGANDDIKFEIIFGEENGKIVDNKVYALTNESFIFVGKVGNVESNIFFLNHINLNSITNTINTNCYNS